MRDACRLLIIDRNRPLLINSLYVADAFGVELRATAWCWGTSEEKHYPHWVDDPSPQTRKRYHGSLRFWGYQDPAENGDLVRYRLPLAVAWC